MEVSADQVEHWEQAFESKDPQLVFCCAGLVGRQTGGHRPDHVNTGIQDANLEFLHVLGLSWPAEQSA